MERRERERHTGAVQRGRGQIEIANRQGKKE
jgi:hypothetical protein